MGLGAALFAFLFACAAAVVAVAMGFSVFSAVLVYSGVGAVSLLLAVIAADTYSRMSGRRRAEAQLAPVISPIQ